MKQLRMALTAAILWLAMLISGTVALAETNQVVYAKDIAAVYKTASTQTELFRVTVATRMTVTGESGDYYKIITRTGSHTGYIKKSMTVSKAPDCPTEIAYTNAANVPVYRKGTSSSEKLTTLPQNTKLKIVGESGNYYAVTKTDDVLVGYINKTKLSKAKTTATAAPAATKFVEKTGYAAGIVPLYKTASTSTELYRLTTATRLRIVGESGSYYKVITRTGSHEGYIKKSDVSEKAPACPTEIGYVTENGVICYKNASSSAAQWGTYKQNTQLKIVGESGKYYAVTKTDDVQVGYILKTKMSKTKVTAATPKPAATKFVEKTGYAARIIPLYKTASTSTELFRITTATRLRIVGESGSFYKVITRTGGYEGYVRKSDVSEKAPACPTEVCYVAANGTVSYKTASSAAAQWGTYKLNSQVKVVGESGSYYAITDMSDVKVGYILKSKISKTKVTATATAKPNATPKPAATATPKPNATPTPVPGNRGTYHSDNSSTTMPDALKSRQTSVSSTMSNAQKIEYAIYWAQQRLGFYYSTRPNNTTTFDCLTLCYYAYAQTGVRIPDSSYACGYTGSFKYIYSVDSLKRGDIVCFDTLEDGDSSDHVGIYLGSGYFIHCSSGAGMVVVSNMSSGYYREHFFCGRRILET